VTNNFYYKVLYIGLYTAMILRVVENIKKIIFTVLHRSNIYFFWVLLCEKNNDNKFRLFQYFPTGVSWRQPKYAATLWSHTHFCTFDDSNWEILFTPILSL